MTQTKLVALIMGRVTRKCLRLQHLGRSGAFRPDRADARDRPSTRECARYLWCFVFGRENPNARRHGPMEGDLARHSQDRGRALIEDAADHIGATLKERPTVRLRTGDLVLEANQALNDTDLLIIASAGRRRGSQAPPWFKP